MKRIRSILAAAILMTGWVASEPAFATDVTLASCGEYILGQPEIAGQPTDGDEALDHIDAWYESPNDSLYDYIDGSRIENVEHLRDRITASHSALQIIYNARFDGWDFTRLGDAAQGLCFYRGDLSGSRWDGLDLSRSGFVQSSLSGSSMRGANLDRVLFDDVSLQGADMQGARLRHGSLSGGWFRDLSEVTGEAGTETGLNNWNLTRADLTGFRFNCGIEIHNGCPLHRQIIFTGADLGYADLSAFPGWGEFRISGARLDRTRIAPNQLVYFAEADLAGPIVLAGQILTSTLDPGQTRMLIDQFGEAEALSEMASFDCNGATGRVEQTICSEEGSQWGLKREDSLMAAAYIPARARDPGIAASQQEWIGRRNSCDDYECVLSHYVGRTQTLMGIAGLPVGIDRGQMALFVGGQPDVLPDFRSSELWQWLSPVLADAAHQTIVVAQDSDGLWSIRGRSIGANAHVCTIGQSGLRFDRTTGWFISDPNDGTRTTPVFRIVGNELQVLGNGHPDRESYPDSDFVSCGARANFGWSNRLTLSEEEIAQIWYRLGAE